MMVVHMTNQMDAADWVLLADVPCHQKMRLCSFVCCASACLLVPLSWQLEPPCGAVPSGQISGSAKPSTVQVTLQSLASATLRFVHTAELNGVPVRVLFDTGATHSFIDSSFAAKQGFALSTTVDYGVTLGDGRLFWQLGAQVHCS
jgi:predicted aspartyl protease